MKTIYELETWLKTHDNEIEFWFDNKKFYASINGGEVVKNSATLADAIDHALAEMQSRANGNVDEEFDDEDISILSAMRKALRNKTTAVTASCPPPSASIGGAPATYMKPCPSCSGGTYIQNGNFTSNCSSCGRSPPAISAYMCPRCGGRPFQLVNDTTLRCANSFCVPSDWTIPTPKTGDRIRLAPGYGMSFDGISWNRIP